MPDEKQSEQHHFEERREEYVTLLRDVHRDVHQIRSSLDTLRDRVNTIADETEDHGKMLFGNGNRKGIVQVLYGDGDKVIGLVQEVRLIAKWWLWITHSGSYGLGVLSLWLVSHLLGIM